jgi:hypothetical protein
MTIKTIDRKYAEILLRQLSVSHPINLELNGPILTTPHPKILWTKLLFEEKLHEKIPQIALNGWNYDCFKDPTSAEMTYPNIKTKFVGKPWTFFEFLTLSENSRHHSEVREAIIDFKDLGTIVLSKNSLNPFHPTELHDYVLPQWIHYTLSPELWGPYGKWTLFHQRLHHLFSEQKLLESTDSVGYYPLDPKLAKLDSFGFKGTINKENYLLVLPWCFSLSALNKLEKIIRQEF